MDEHVKCWQGYHGRRWDAPMTDDMEKIDLTGEQCSLCLETITADDDGLLLGSLFHTECLLRSTLGDVFHLRRECMCFGGDKHDEEGTYREQAQRALAAVIANGGGWADG